MSAHEGDEFDDSQQTAIDPEVPTGVRDRPVHFDPHARLADNRKPLAGPGRVVAHEVIAALPPVRHDDLVAPKARAASSFDPHGRIDDSSRTAKWTPREPEPRAPTAAPAQAPVPRDRSEPIRAISMKTPGAAGAEQKPQRVLPVVKLRAMSEVQPTPGRGMGNLAPPRDPRAARSRRVRDNVIWASVAVILASIVTLAIWFLARR